MPRSLASKVRVYAAMADKLSKLRDYLEVYAMFDWRDDVYEDLQGGELLDSESVALLEHADQKLIEERATLLQRFPDLFHPDRKARIRRECWWWHLDEGPQVREQARALAKRS